MYDSYLMVADETTTHHPMVGTRVQLITYLDGRWREFRTPRYLAPEWAEEETTLHLKNWMIIPCT